MSDYKSRSGSLASKHDYEEDDKPQKMKKVRLAKQIRALSFAVRKDQEGFIHLNRDGRSDTDVVSGNHKVRESEAEVHSPQGVIPRPRMDTLVREQEFTLATWKVVLFGILAIIFANGGVEQTVRTAESLASGLCSALSIPDLVALPDVSIPQSSGFAPAPRKKKAEKTKPTMAEAVAKLRAKKRAAIARKRANVAEQKRKFQRVAAANKAAELPKPETGIAVFGETKCAIREPEAKCEASHELPAPSQDEKSAMHMKAQEDWEDEWIKFFTFMGGWI